MDEMTKFWPKLFELLSQFTGGRGGVDYNIVQFCIAAFFWASLIIVAGLRKRRLDSSSEELMVLGFSFGLMRELFMLAMALLQQFGIIDSGILHAVFPPLEHAIFDVAIITVAAAYLARLTDRPKTSETYLKVGVGAVSICYFLTFWWWGLYVIANPQSHFGQTWCDWLFRINASILLLYPLVILYRQPRSLVRNLVCLALTFFFLYEFLKIPDLAFGEVYEPYFAPVRHGLYLLGIPLFGFVYFRERYFENRLIEKKLQESEERYRLLFEDSRDALYLSSNDGYFVNVNRACIDLFGLDRQEILKVKISDLYADPEDRTKFKGVIAEYGAVVDYEVKLAHRDGRTLDCLLSATQRVDGSGMVVGYQGNIRDVTVQRQIEQQFRQTEKMEAMGTLAGGIAHDFNNILTAIIGYSFIAKREVPEDSAARKAIDEINRAGNRAKDLVKQILAFSRRDDQVKKPLHLQIIIKEALKLLRATIPTTIEINHLVSADDVVILAEPTQILQLLINLCTNAFHAMHGKGCLEIVIRRTNLQQDDNRLQTGFAEGDYVELVVSDTGPGIDQSIISKIFDPFFTTKDVGEGTGMGLSVVHGIVKGHDGFINVESMVGEGAQFHVFFPAALGAVDDEECGDKRVIGGSERVLFVDDEQTIVTLAKLTLDRLGYKVTAASSAVEALAVFKGNPDKFDLVITDQAMPQMSGVELAVEILKIRPEMPIILCTGYSAVVSEEGAHAIGIREFVMKPLAEQKLAQIVRRVLDNQVAMKR